jgi:hypothetical protein
MSKRVIDILPPDETEETGAVSFKRKIKKPKKKRFRKFLFFLILILIITGIGYGSLSSKVEVEIWPVMNDFGGKLRVTVDGEIEDADLAKRILPGYFLEEQNSLSRSFPATGEPVEGGKAEGIIRIYNDYSNLSQSLRANTRFMAASGEVFRTPTRVVIPGKKIEKGKEVSGYIDIKVVADKPGSEYNIESTSFSIPGLAGTALYTKFYGKSFNPMVGGSEDETPQVTKEDLEKAEEAVVNKLKMEGRQVLEQKALDSDFIFLKEALKQETKATSSSVRIGTGIENFDFSAKVQSTALVLEKEAIDSLILNQIPEGKKMYEKSLDVDWKSEEVDLIQGKIILNLDFSGKIYPGIDQLSLRKELTDKGLSEAKRFLEGQEGVYKVEISSWPFWVKKIPRNINKVKIKLQLD